MVWAAVPGYLQAYRGSHVVITTIMFNFLASTLLVYLLVNPLKAPGSMSVESRALRARGAPARHERGASALVRCRVAVLAAQHQPVPGPDRRGSRGLRAFLWRSRAGYRLRAVGSSEGAAEPTPASIPKRQVMLAMGISGALAGLVGMNEIAGVNGKLLLDFVGGAGFTGIAVAVMGRNHPVGIVHGEPVVRRACSRVAPR